MPRPDPPSAPVAAPAPAQPPPEAVAPDSIFHGVLGFVLLTACLELGEGLKHGLGLILPGSILGLFLLLALLGAGVVPLRWVESAARWLLWLLPLLFMPIFTLALKDHQFWMAQGRAVAGAVALATLLLWLLVGHVAQWMLHPPPAAEIPNSKLQIPSSKLQSGGSHGVLCLLPLPFCLNLDPWSLFGAWNLGFGTLPLGLSPLELGAWNLEFPPLLGAAGWSLLTVAVYFACRWVFLRTRWSLLHPGLTGILTMAAILESAGRAYGPYEHATAWINWLLGPAVVAMAVPIYQLRQTVHDNARVLAVAIPLGLAFAIVSTPTLLAAAGRARPVVASGALKSITSPVGLRLALDAHVSMDATVAGILLAGMLGATVGIPVMRRLGVRDERALGLALGCTSHGIGVAKALELGRAGGAFASLGMSGTAMLGAMVLPFVLRWLAGAG